MLCVSASIATGLSNGEYIEWHQYFGITVLCLILFRIYWGFAGTRTALFKNFFPTVTCIKNYMKNPDQITGHNPFGAMSVFAMLGLLLLQTISGLFSFEEESEFYAPLSVLITEELSIKITGWHIELVNAVLVLLGFHLLAIAYHQVIKGRPIIEAMLLKKYLRNK